MRLREVIKPPARLDEEEHIGMPPKKKTTLPLYPELLKAQCVPFRKDSGNSAFPSLPLGKPLNPQESQEESDLGPSRLENEDEDYHDSLASHPADNEGDSETGDDFGHSNTSSWSANGTGYAEEEFELEIDSNEPIAWMDLELSVQYQIFTRLLQYHLPRAIVQFLGLTDREYYQIESDIRKRQHQSFSSQEAHDFLSSDGCLDPVLAARYVTDLLFDGKYEEAYPISVQRGFHFLRQGNLVATLLGDWYLDPEGSGMLRCVTHTLQPSTARSFDSGYQSNVGSGNAPATLASTAVVPDSAVQSLHKRPREQSTNEEGIAQVSQNTAQPRKAPRKLPYQDALGDTIIVSNRQPSTTSKALKRPRPLPNSTSSSNQPTPIVPAPVRLSTDGPGGRQAGEHTLRSREKMRMTEKGAELLNQSQFWTDGLPEPSEREELPSSPSSAFVTLGINKTAPKLSISRRTGEAIVSSSPVPSTPDAPTTGRTPTYDSPFDAAGTIQTNRRYSSIPPMPTTPTKLEPYAWKHPKLMHDSEVYTSYFKLMPDEERERLLSIHPADLNIAQRWLIYGVEAYNKRRPWNSNFAEKAQSLPELGSRLDVATVDTTLCRALVNQYNCCLSLGLNPKFFEGASIGKDVINGYTVLMRYRAQLEELAVAKKTLGTLEVDAAFKNQESAYRQTEIKLWDSLKAKYSTSVFGSAKEKLDSYGSPRIIAYEKDIGFEGPSRSSAARVGTPSTTPGIFDRENTFTTKALGIEAPMRDTDPPAPSFSTTGHDAQAVGYQTPIKEPSNAIGSHFVFGSRGAQDSSNDGDQEMTDVYVNPDTDGSSPLAAKASRKKQGALTPLPEITTTPAPPRRPSIEAPSFSPIIEDDIQSFLAKYNEVHAVHPITYSPQEGPTPAPSSPGGPSEQGNFVSAHENLDSGVQDAQAPETVDSVEEEKQPSAETHSLPKLKLNFGAGAFETETATSQPAESVRSDSEDPLQASAPGAAPEKSSRQKKKTPSVAPSSRGSTPAGGTRRQIAIRDHTPSDGTRSRAGTPDGMSNLSMPDIQPDPENLLRQATSKAARVTKDKPKAKKIKEEAEAERVESKKATPKAKPTPKTPVKKGTSTKHNGAVDLGTPATAAPSTGKGRGKGRKTLEKERLAREAAESEEAEKEKQVMSPSTGGKKRSMY